MKKLKLRDLPGEALKGKRALVRVDFNVPIEGDRVTDDTRIRATLPTLNYLVENGARVILLSHRGRPKGKWNAELSLRPAAERLRELLRRPVHFVEDVVGAAAHSRVDGLASGEVVLLENVRFLSGEETDDPELAEALAALGDVYVNDAFGTAHRAHASTSGAPLLMKKEGRPAVAGFLMEEELRFLGQALEAPERPFVAVLGGAKISGKIDVIENLLSRVDRLVIGGAMANTFFRALGLETGRSLVEEDRVELARELLERAGDKLVLPVDAVAADDAKPGAHTSVVERDAVLPDAKILDIGPRSVALFAEFLEPARTVVWNGPMGLFEIPEFGRGTEGVARVLAEVADGGATVIIGGGDTVAAVESAHVADRMTHVSTGGGAALELLEGRTLPGVAVLSDRDTSDSL